MNEISLTALPLIEHPNILTFHAFHTQTGLQSGRAYLLELA